MKYLLILFCLLSFTCFAKTNEKYSNKAFPYHNLSFKDRPASEFNNTTIQGTCFYQEWTEGDKDVEKDIFPDGMTGVTFINCNLDNIYIPHGNTVNGGSNRKLKVQNDWDDWLLDAELKPTEPTNKETRLRKNISISPVDIPIDKMTKEEHDDFENTFNISL